MVSADWSRKSICVWPAAVVTMRSLAKTLMPTFRIRVCRAGGVPVACGLTAAATPISRFWAPAPEAARAVAVARTAARKAHPNRVLVIGALP